MNRATSLADVSLAAGAQISDLLIELREKATAAADPSQTAATRKAYNDEFQSLLKSLQSFADNATFDGENILNGKIGGADGAGLPGQRQRHRNHHREPPGHVADRSGARADDLYGAGDRL